ncbi:MAG: hypothetical protein A2Y24_08410 [Clostridiales bacterium GWE2_32_10]|nr:MAG: hypothetical protein A2Y24_08410 [Clostridiales bacterium GWE2_32_10]
MNIDKFIEILFNTAKQKGLSDYEVYYEKSRSFSVNIYEGDIEEYKNSLNMGLSFRTLYNGQMGYAYTENIDEASITLLVDEAIANAAALERETVEFLYEGEEKYEDVDNYKGEIEKIDTDKKINLVKKIEAEAKKIDDRVKSLQYCLYKEAIVERIIANSKGLRLTDKMDYAYCYINVVVKENDDAKTSEAELAIDRFDETNFELFAKETVDEAISLLGAKSIKSGSYDVIIKNKTFALLLREMINVFSAEAVEKGLSMFANKIGDKVATEDLTIIDDPYLKGRLNTKAFDDEGVGTKVKKVIEKGVLNTYLHNLKTSKKAGIESTGNGKRNSYKGEIGISPFNLYIEPGDKDLDEMKKELNTGLLLIKLDGLHAGLNTISGDFSLIASGYYIENGEIKKPVNQITLAGNFFDVLRNIDVIGSDLKFEEDSVKGIGSPSVLIRNMKIAGE